MPKHQPTVIIGLGGTGKAVILALKRMLAENKPNGINSFPFLRIMSFDTDRRVDRSTSSIETIAQDQLSIDANHEIYSLSSDFVGAPDLDPFPELKEWFPPSQRAQINSAMLAEGAGAIKPVGRFTFAWKASEIHAVINALLNAPVDQARAAELGIGTNDIANYTNVFICGSVCGGTGAGTFLDMAYLVRHIARSLNRDIFLYGLLALSSLFAGRIRTGVNCYASMVEFDYFSSRSTCENEYRRFKPAYRNFYHNYEDTRISASAPFDFPFLFDNINARNLALSRLEALAEMQARFIYLLTGHEVAESYRSVDSNVSSNIPNYYNYTHLGKPHSYRSMGAFSVLLPKRMIKQLCGYLFTQRYFELILEDSAYDTTMIGGLLGDWLKDAGFFPGSDRFLQQLQNFKDASGQQYAFGDFVDEVVRSFEVPKDMHDARNRLQDFFNQMEREVVAFEMGMSSRPREIKTLFMAKITEQVSSMLDLRIKTDEQRDRTTRGSLARTIRFLEQLLEMLRQEDATQKKNVEFFEKSAKALKEEFQPILDDIEKAARGLIPRTGRFKAGVQEALGKIKEYCLARMQKATAIAIQQWCEGIVDRGIFQEDGILDCLDRIRMSLERTSRVFKQLQVRVNATLRNGRTYAAGDFCKVIFDFDRDVLKVYQNEVLRAGEDLLLVELSDSLKMPRVFGPIYGDCEKSEENALLRTILVRAESKFDTAIQEIDIEKRIMEDPEVKQNFTNGLYLSMASEYIILDGNELGKVNVSLQRSRFYAITIPDNYAERSCFQMKGDLSAIPNSERRCPVDLGRIPGCPMHGACLKQLILATSPSYLAIVPCEDRSEVNIISTIAGFPLHACATLQSAKIEYTEMRTNVMRRLRDDQRPDEESIHMFGMVKYPDLFTRAEDVGMLMAEYKTMILLAWILKRIDIQKLSVMFFTHQDMQNRRVVPSLRLGENIVDLMRKTQSNEIAEIRKRKIFLDDMALHVESIMADTEQKKRYQDALKARYRRMNGDTPDLPPGIQREDAQYLEDYSVKTFGTSLQDTTVVPLGVPSEF